ncbi:hypothetical protein HUN33_00445 [Acinetobacter bereziniae]|uniref:hypothetical protein n=1 Tax=Acinetobacter bereziniae TaxID=106648 RepID=UPI0015806DE1|nr:hypothetical protein [Acinetobacter bereziniae]NUF61558.1 hypothetical protein [Acinetobacter bereziniae]NUG06164.1 hypothetical protein [Acinetobacter bereziniae]NUG62319.1 hypothetical protein [Acinetobacter bereziniae]NUG69179.1 hypothetical protein [Acinetobacter bereziniae]NUG78527.1 hypothetical protein [Acinetobacter bereziniae]
MNVVEFVKKFGWEGAKKAIAKVAWCETAYCIMIKHGCFKSNSDCCVDITDLKRLVESYELVKTWQLPEDDHDETGVDGARMYLECYACYSTDEEKAKLDRLEQAIEDVESVGGGV